MSELDVKQVINNKNEAINKLNEYLDNCIVQDDKYLKKANLLSYWLKDYINYIQQEETFNSSHLKEYSRGDIIKANLGFNVGNEEGGLHYCVVLDKKNSKSYSTLTVIPLSSIKVTTKPNKTSVFLGDDIYQCLLCKHESMLTDAQKQVDLAKIELENIRNLPENTEEEKIIKSFKITKVDKRLKENENNLSLIIKIQQELNETRNNCFSKSNNYN